MSKENNKARAIELIGIYNEFRRKALDEGFTYDAFWAKVNFYITDIFHSDAGDWALAGQLAYEDLVAERDIDRQPENISDYYYY
jgi:hypothetical protein